MGRTYKFSIIQAVPDARRNERVNVGIVVFLSDRIDVRLPEARKLQALTAHSWNEVGRLFSDYAAKSFNPSVSVEETLGKLNRLSDVFTLSLPGEVAVPTKVEEYEERVRQIMEAFVLRPRLTRTERQQRINTEISRLLRQWKILAKKGQTIEDHKVVPKFVVSEEKELVADFAYKNGIYRVVSTIDMRGGRVSHAKACEKGATLHFAKEAFGSNTVGIGVYAVEPTQMEAYRSEIGILRDFSNVTFNWLDPNDRSTFTHLLQN